MSSILTSSAIDGYEAVKQVQGYLLGCSAFHQKVVHFLYRGSVLLFGLQQTQRFVNIRCRYLLVLSLHLLRQIALRYGQISANRGSSQGVRNRRLASLFDAFDDCESLLLLRGLSLLGLTFSVGRQLAEDDVRCQGLVTGCGLCGGIGTAHLFLRHSALHEDLLELRGRNLVYPIELPC